MPSGYQSPIRTRFGRELQHLLDREALAALPNVANVIFMAGRKFGSEGTEELTWAMNVHMPALITERYCEARTTL